MLILLSPAKSLDESPFEGDFERTQPRLLAEAEALVEVLKTYSAEQLKELMSISDSLAELNRERFQSWHPEFTPDNAKPALWTFTGDVYQGMDLEGWDARDRQWARGSLRILSGLYGLLRPEDLMMPYRLEMGTRLAGEWGKNLYEYWGAKITDLINADLEAGGYDWVCNLASKEYYSSVKPRQLAKPVISPVFKDEKQGRYKIISFHAKKARGMMADFIIREQVKTPAQLRDFTLGGYAYSEEESSDEAPVFLRPEGVRA